jgi:hypothetical protein
MTFQQVSNVANAKDSSPEKFETSMEKTADAIQSIRDGADDGAKLQTAFARLGVTLDDIKKKNHQQVFFEIAEHLKSAEITTERLAALKDIFGKSAGELIPIFKEGFGGAVANRGTLSEKEIKDLLELKKIGKEASEPWENLGREAVMMAGRIKAGLMGFPGLIYGYFAGGDNSSGNSNTASMQQRLLAHDTQKAEAEAAKAAQKKKKDELEKRAKEIAKDYAEEQKRAAKEEVASASPSRRRQILRARNQAIDSQIDGIDTQIRNNGDPDGSLALRRLQLVNQRSEYRREYKEAGNQIKGISLLPDHVSERARIGLYTGRSSNSEAIFRQQLTTMQQHLTVLHQAVRELQGMRQDITEP